jgi:L-asparaginase/Glu-tRNA(Gln) amidotransferase subunit D
VTKRVLVAFTGGTIGARAAEGAIDVVSGQTRLLLDRFNRSAVRDVEFDVIEPFNTLSENIEPERWSQLAEAVRGAVDDVHDGVVITHGTDTLSFTASAMGFALAGLRIPIFLVASDLPLDDPLANGPANFESAIRFIKEVSEVGVFVVYRNPDGTSLIHYGTRLLAATPMSHFFLSVDGAEYGDVRNDHIRLREPRGLLPGTRRFSRSELESAFAHNVLLLRPYPGLNYSNLDLSGVQAVVHDLYHSGTACVSPKQETRSLVWLAASCQSADIPLFVVPWSDNEDLYGSARILLESGVTSVTRMSATAAYVKVMLGLGNGMNGDALRKFVVSEELANEFV